MTTLYLVIPLALLVVSGAVAAFAWVVRSGQLDDLETPPRRVLYDDDGSAPAVRDAHGLRGFAARRRHAP